LQEVSFSFQDGFVYAVLGANGSGKSTVLNVIMGILRQSTGRISFGESDISHWAPHRRVSIGISMAAQFSTAVPILSTLQNLALNKEHAVSKNRDLIAALKLEHIAHTKAKFLSGGELKRLEYAMAIQNQPKWLLLDEPFSGIDPKSSEIIIRSIDRLIQGGNTSVIIADHNLQYIHQIANRFLFLNGGHVFYFDSWQDFLTANVVRDTYLGN
jgi:ABC-type lipopolysaccharide export system ATPase subunit